MADDGIEGLNPTQREQLRVGAALLTNPEVRRDVQKLYKRVNPKAVIPELEVEEQITRARAEDNERFEKVEKENMQLRVKQREAERKEQCAAAGLDYDDVCKTIIEEKCSFETAMKILELQNRTAEPGAGEVRGSHAGAPLELRPGEDFRKAGGNIGALRRVSANLAGEMIDQMRGRKPRAR